METTNQKQFWAVRIFDGPDRDAPEIFMTTASSLRLAKRLAAGMRDSAFLKVSARPIVRLYDAQGYARYGSAYDSWRMQWNELERSWYRRIVIEEASHA